MKKFLPLTVLLAVLPFGPSHANLLNNADFEAGPTELKEYNFKETPGWWNRAKREEAQSAAARRTFNDESKYNAIANDKGESLTSFNQKTSHAIQAGDVFQVALDLCAGMDWQSRDVLRVVAFATANNTQGGEVVWQESVDFDDGYSKAWRSETRTFPPATSAAQGRTLFFNFYGVDPQGIDKIGFLRVDNIVLTVQPAATP